jgi:hypothetical protein
VVEVKENGLARSGNIRVRFLQFQQNSALARVERDPRMPVARAEDDLALARKLLMGLWHLAGDGVVSEGRKWDYSREWVSALARRLPMHECCVRMQCVSAKGDVMLL